MRGFVLCERLVVCLGSGPATTLVNGVDDMTTFVRILSVASAAALSTAAFLALPALAVQTEKMPGETLSATGVSPSLIVFNQKFDGKSIELNYVYMPKKGFVVIYAGGSNGKAAGDPIGIAPVEAGNHNHFKVELTAAVKPGAKLWAALAEDKNADGKFEKTGDVAYWAMDALPLANEFVIQ